MKFCPKCGSKNKADAKFCKKCGAVFNNVSQQTPTPHTREEAKQAQQNHNKSNKWLIIILIVIILVLLFVIGCALGKSTGSSSSSSSASKSTMTKQSSELTPKQKQDAQSQQQHNTSNQSNLTLKTLTPQQTAAAIAFYERNNGVQSGMAWDSLQSNAAKTVTLTNNDDESISNKGAGVTYSFDTQSGGGCEYTLSDNGQTVNFYTLGDSGDSDSSDSPSLQEIVDYVNRQKAAQTVRNVAGGVKIVDDRKQKLNTKDLTEGQLKDWALQTFKNTYSDSADDDLSVDYLGLDDDKDAEVTVHDNDNSDMDTTYRVNSDGVLQEQDGDDWTTVSTSFSE